MRQSAANTHIVKRFLFVVDGHDAFASGAAHFHHESLVSLKLLQALGRLKARHAINVASQQGGHLGRRVIDKSEGDFLHFDVGGIAVAIPFGQCDSSAFGPVF